MRWIDEGRDVMALMPYLSTYMGTCQLRRNPILYTPFAGKIKILARNRLEDAERYIPDRGRDLMKKIKDPALFEKIRKF